MQVYALIDHDKHDSLIGVFTDAWDAIGQAFEQAGDDPVVQALTPDLHRDGYVFAAAKRMGSHGDAPVVFVRRHMIHEPVDPD